MVVRVLKEGSIGGWKLYKNDYKQISKIKQFFLLMVAKNGSPSRSLANFNKNGFALIDNANYDNHRNPTKKNIISAY